MNTNAILISVGAGVIVLALSLLLEPLNEWLAKRKAERIIKKFKDGTLKKVDLEDPKHGTIRTDNSSVNLNHLGKAVDSVPWKDILEIIAFKRDLFSVDLICIAIKFTNNGEELYLELHEEMVGFKTFLKELEERFVLRESDWWSKVAFPAFATNETVLWKRGDPTKP